MRTLASLVALSCLITGCSLFGSADSCEEYAEDVRALIETNPSAAEVERFLDETEETVARLISRNPDAAEPCVEAVFELTFIGIGADLEESLGE